MKAQCDICGTSTKLYRVKILNKNNAKVFKMLCFKCVQKHCGYSPMSTLSRNKHAQMKVEDEKITNSNI